VHPFTLLNLPATAPNMALELCAQYRSDLGPPTSPIDYYLPFGSGFSLSGLDFLYVPVRPGQNVAPSDAEIYRGDGVVGEYALIGSGPLYTSPAGLIDGLEWDSSLPGFRRNLPDGRVITYVEVVPDGQYFKRTQVVDRSTYLSVDYDYEIDAGLNLPRLKTITDTRGIEVTLTWQGTGAITNRRIQKLAITTLNPAPELTFLYDASAQLEHIEYFPTTVVVDSTPDGTIDLVNEKFASVRPTITLEWQNGRITKVKDTTLDGAGGLPNLPETRLWISYGASNGRVDQIVEGDSATTDPVRDSGTTCRTSIVNTPARVAPSPTSTSTAVGASSKWT